MKAVSFAGIACSSWWPREEGNLRCSRLERFRDGRMEGLNRRNIWSATCFTFKHVSSLQVVVRDRRPAEILEEYERLKREEQERQMQLKTTPNSLVQIDVDATDLISLSPYEERYKEKLECTIIWGWLFCRICMASSVWIFFRSVIDAVDIRRINASIELECPLTANDTVTLGTELTVENGLGQGALATAYRRTLNENCWLEVCIANPSSFADNWIMIH